MPKFKYFAASEVEGLNDRLVYLLDVARGISGVPYKITSGRRTAAQNKKAGGVKDSSHLKGLAVDLSAPDSRTMFLVLRGLFEAGFQRIGVYMDGHVHADIDETLDEDVLWVKED